MKTGNTRFWAHFYKFWNNVVIVLLLNRSHFLQILSPPIQIHLLSFI
jgi:hypothetical protein